MSAAERPPPRATRTARPPALAAVLVSLSLGACGFFDAPVVQRGNRVTADQLREVTPGVQTKADVRAALGSPTQTGMFGDDEWYYISSTTRQRPGRQFVVNDRQTVVVEFDRAGVVRGIRTLGEDDTRPVEMVARETPVPGNERTFLQALFGNVGRFGAGALGAQPQQTTPGVGSIGQGASGLAR
ncbi:MAG: outer membrane protein assembly factor BamE [Acetobacteraceae bacterium]|nr:outer membrane protein assembly factor BamE [Acetobacteraceae bacterium]